MISCLSYSLVDWVHHCSQFPVGYILLCSLVNMSRNATILSYAGVNPTSSVGDGISALRASAPQLAGSSPREKLEVDMWLTFATKPMSNEMYSALNSTLVYKTFLVGSSISLADFAVFDAVSEGATSGSFKNLTRWAKHINNFVPVTMKMTFGGYSHTAIPVATVDSVGKQEPSAPQAPANGRTPALTLTPVASAAPKAEEADKAEDGAAGLDPTKLDIRVGQVVKCWNHPDSDKLLCEEVDLGGGEVRNIASGIRAFYTAEQLQGRKVVVLTNLKERSIAGFKSQVI
jgi:methionine--tRNA ligase beta chain